MANSKLVLTTLTLIVFLIVLSHANHLPLDLPDDDSKSIHDHPSLTLPDPDFQKTILLPSEKPESEPATVVDLTQHDDDEEIESNIEKALMMSDLTEVDEKEEVPEAEPEGKVVFMDLRPITRPRFPVGKGMFEIHRPHHPCHHPRPRHHHDFYHQFDMEEVKPSEVSYGNDMLMEEGAGRPEEEEFDRMGEHHGGGEPGRRAPSSWFSFHFGGKPRFDPEHDHHDHEHDRDHPRPDEEDEDRRPDHRRRDREEEEHHHHDHDHDHGHHRHHDDFGEEMRMKRPFGQEHRDGGGLMKRVRKFLHLLEF